MLQLSGYGVDKRMERRESGGKGGPEKAEIPKVANPGELRLLATALKEGRRLSQISARPALILGCFLQGLMVVCPWVTPQFVPLLGFGRSCYEWMLSARGIER